MSEAPPGELRTVGHSTRPADEFVALLLAFRITHLIDVRTIPRSRHNPQFDATALPRTVAAAGITYTHRADLGGLRRPAKASPNGGWRNTSFRGFADYMQTAPFAVALDWLLQQARQDAVAIMCAELLPWRCHRSLIADALTLRGLRVCHILQVDKCHPHRLTPWARVEGERITYPPAQ